METIKIATFNVRNNSKRLFYCGVSKNGVDYAKILAHHINRTHIDIIGSQELVSGYIRRLKKLLPLYKFAGEYRKGNKKRIYIANESNSIITKLNIIKTKTKYLPYLPKSIISFLKDYLQVIPRIITSALIETNNKNKIYFFNTHLAYTFKDVQERQLKKVLEIIKKQVGKYPIILTGDFNMDIYNPLFKDFIDKLEELNITRVPVNETTHTLVDDPAIDHIFISKEFKLVNLKIGNEILNSISDHKIIEIEVQI